MIKRQTKTKQTRVWKVKKIFVFYASVLLVYVMSGCSAQPSDADPTKQAISAYLTGQALEKGQQYKAAVKNYEKAVSLAPDNVTYLYALASLYHQLLEYDAAIDTYQKTLDAFYDKFSIYSEGSPQLAIIRYRMGLAWSAKKNYDKAIEYYHLALSNSINTYGEEHAQVAQIYQSLAQAWKEKKDYNQATQYFELSLKLDLKLYDENHPSVATDLNGLGLVSQEEGFYDKAIQYFNKALKIDSASYGDEHYTLVRDLNNLGTAWRGKGRYEKAVDYYEKALIMSTSILGAEHSKTKLIARNLALTLANEEKQKVNQPTDVEI